MRDTTGFRAFRAVTLVVLGVFTVVPLYAMVTSPASARPRRRARHGLSLTGQEHAYTVAAASCAAISLICWVCRSSCLPTKRIHW